jgi:hypothetical protein
MEITSIRSSAPVPLFNRMQDKGRNLDADVLWPLISAGILNMVNGPIIAGTTAHNVMQENNIWLGSSRNVPI